MYKTCLGCVLALVAMALASSANAVELYGPEPAGNAQVIGPTQGVLVAPPAPMTPYAAQYAQVLSGYDYAYVIERPVVAPGATVSRDLARQPVRPDLAELELDNMQTTSTIYIDPYKCYTSPSYGYLPEDNSIVRAQRLWLMRHTGTPVTVVHGLGAQPQMSAANIKPEFIIEAPKAGQAQPDMPSVPESPQAPPMVRRMASAAAPNGAAGN